MPARLRMSHQRVAAAHRDLLGEPGSLRAARLWSRRACPVSSASRTGRPAAACGSRRRQQEGAPGRRLQRSLPRSPRASRLGRGSTPCMQLRCGRAPASCAGSALRARARRHGRRLRRELPALRAAPAPGFARLARQEGAEHAGRRSRWRTPRQWPCDNSWRRDTPKMAGLSQRSFTRLGVSFPGPAPAPSRITTTSQECFVSLKNVNKALALNSKTCTLRLMSG